MGSCPTTLRSYLQVLKGSEYPKWEREKAKVKERGRQQNISMRQLLKCTRNASVLWTLTKTELSRCLKLRWQEELTTLMILLLTLSKLTMKKLRRRSRDRWSLVTSLKRRTSSTF